MITFARKFATDMAQLSNRLQRLAPSATLAMSQKSSEMKAQGIDVINIEWPIQGVCPDGWHIPTLEEWEKLFHYVLDITGGHSLAKTLMTTESWGNKEHGGYNTFGFTVKPSGEAYCLNWRVIDEAKHFSAVQYGTYYMISGEGNSRMYVKFGNAEENVEPMFDRTTGDTYVYPNIRCILGEGSKGIHPQADDSEKN